jgi:hypothetical protein
MFQKTTFDYAKADNFSSYSDYFAFNFGSAKEPVDGVVDLVHGTHTCREGLMSNMRSRICGSGTTQPTDKTRMLFFWYASRSNSKKDQVEVKGWTERTVPVIQALDRVAGWPLTRVYQLKTGRDHITGLYYHSSRRWMKSSYLISLYIMLVRMCKDERITGFKDFDGLVKLLDKLCKNNGESNWTGLKSDQGYVKDSLPYWESIMRGYPRLFRARKMDYYWDTDRLGGSSGGYEGIQYLVGGNTKYTEVKDEMLKIKKELKAGTFTATKKEGK